MKLYDENEAVDFIIRKLGEDSKTDKDTILDVIDALYDYYEENDELDFDFDEDDEDTDLDICENEIDAIVTSVSRKVEVPTEIIRNIVVAEQKYQDTLL